jgi:predicted ATPase
MASDTFQSITIEGFKSIRSIKIDLRPINILIGANGSGKSNFLEAFVFLQEAQAGRMDSYVSKYRGADRLLHYGSRTTQEITIHLHSSNFRHLAAYYGYVAGDNLAEAIPEGGLLAGAIAEGGFVDRTTPSFRRYQFHDTGFHSPFKKTNDLSMNNRFLFPDGSNLASFLFLLKQRYRESYDLIRKTVGLVAPFFEDFNLEPQALNPETIKLEWKHKRSDREWDSSEFSDGTLRFIALATLFLQPVELRPSVILVDEPELGLHPNAIELLYSLIRQASFETQVIAATQSPFLLDQFEPEDIIVADRIDGATTIQRLDAKRLAEWLTDYSLGQLWEKGELEGKPTKE